MKLSLILLAVISSASAFSAPSAFSRGISKSVITTTTRVETQLFADPEEEEEGLDLNLEEMFEMFDAADKEEDFDDAVKKVKGE